MCLCACKSAGPGFLLLWHHQCLLQGSVTNSPFHTVFFIDFRLVSSSFTVHSHLKWIFEMRFKVVFICFEGVIISFKNAWEIWMILRRALCPNAEVYLLLKTMWFAL